MFLYIPLLVPRIYLNFALHLLFYFSVSYSLKLHLFFTLDLKQL